MIVWKLDELMRVRGIKGRELARRMNIGENYLSRVRHEVPDRLSLTLLDALCRELGCGIADLLEYKVAGRARKAAAPTPKVAAPLSAPAAAEPHVEPVAPHVEPAEPHVEPAEPHVEPAEPHVEPVAPLVQPATPLVQPATPLVQPAALLTEPAVGGVEVPAEEEGSGSAFMDDVLAPLFAALGPAAGIVEQAMAPEPLPTAVAAVVAAKPELEAELESGPEPELEAELEPEPEIEAGPTLEPEPQPEAGPELEATPAGGSAVLRTSALQARLDRLKRKRPQP